MIHKSLDISDAPVCELLQGLSVCSVPLAVQPVPAVLVGRQATGRSGVLPLDRRLGLSQCILPVRRGPSAGPAQACLCSDEERGDWGWGGEVCPPTGLSASRLEGGKEASAAVLKMPRAVLC